MKLYVCYRNLTYNAFFILHAVTPTWAFTNILKVLEIKYVKSMIREFMVQLIPLYVSNFPHIIDLSLLENNKNNLKFRTDMDKINEIKRIIFNQIVPIIPFENMMQKYKKSNKMDDITLKEEIKKIIFENRKCRDYDEHDYKMGQIVWECLQNNIITPHLGLLVLQKLMLPFKFSLIVAKL